MFLLTLAVLATLATAADDTFNYGDTVGINYGPIDWGHVKCENITTCPGWPEDWEWLDARIPYGEDGNSCLDCHNKKTGQCNVHKQSPLHLLRNITDSRRCNDRHKMAFKTGDCARFLDMQFTLDRHALRAFQPLFANGTSMCQSPSNIDFSMGFPDPWHLTFTDVKVPSEHMQDGKRYDAEVVLSHEYSEKTNVDRYIANVAVFLEAGNETDYYDFLDLYIRRWKKEEKRVFDSCHNRQLSQGRTALRSQVISQAEEVENDVSDRDLALSATFRRPFNPYDWLKKVETEYYFRYEGSQTVPPCFSESVHWRVMKNSIRVAPTQIRQLEELIASRVDPITCSADTAGKPRTVASKVVDVNRPIQTVSKGHKVVFCECVDWVSSIAADRRWCNSTMHERGVLPLKERSVVQLFKVALNNSAV